MMGSGGAGICCMEGEDGGNGKGDEKFVGPGS